jgi:hypothetical protein
MNNMEQSSITIKSNVTIKSRGVVPPIDNMPAQYFDTRLNTTLTQEQRTQKEKMQFWAEKVYDENNNLVKDECYKGCQNCGEPTNHCKRPQNRQN